MFGRETVVNGDDYSRKFPCESAANSVVYPRIGSKESESATVEEDYDGEGSAVVLGSRRDEEAKPEVSSRVHFDVERHNAIGRCFIRGRFDVEDVNEAAVESAVRAA